MVAGATNGGIMLLYELKSGEIWACKEGYLVLSPWELEIFVKLVNTLPEWRFWMAWFDKLTPSVSFQVSIVLRRKPILSVFFCDFLFRLQTRAFCKHFTPCRISVGVAGNSFFPGLSLEQELFSACYRLPMWSDAAAWPCFRCLFRTFLEFTFLRTAL